MASLTFKTSTTFKKYVKGKFILRNLAPTENEEICSEFTAIFIGVPSGNLCGGESYKCPFREGTFFFIRGRGDFAGEGHQQNFYKSGRAKPVLFAVGAGSHFHQRNKVLHVASVKVDSLIYVNKHTKSLEN